MSTADLPRAKRRRKTGTSDEFDLHTAIKCSEKLWFHDGNIVLQVEHTRFRVHRSVLERHSSVFRDLFSLPQPPALPENELLVDGCPLIHLSDRVEDVSLVFELLYDSARLNLGPHTPDVSIEQVSAMARLGRKYNISFMEQAARAYLRHDYPASLAKFDAGFHLAPIVAHDDMPFPVVETRIGALNLASEMDWKEIMPAAYLWYFDHAGIDLKMEAMFANTTKPPLPADMHWRALMGREQLVMYLNEKYRTEYEKNFGPYSSWDSDCCAKWWKDKTRIFQAFPIWIREAGELTSFPPYKTQPESRLCKNCEAKMKRLYNSIRAEAWRQLPSFFGLGSWEDLAKI